MQLFRNGCRTDRIRQIFISHLHGDHLYGLPGLLTNWCLKRRTAPLQIFSPPGVGAWIEATCRASFVSIPYPIDFCEIDPGASRRVFETPQLEVWSIPLHHRIPTLGWLFREKDKPRPILAEQIARYQIPYSQIPAIKQGADFLLSDGTVVSNAELTVPPPKSRSYAYCSDTAPCKTVMEQLRGVDLLFHEATFTEEHVGEAQLSTHSTARQAAEIAAGAGVGTLLLGHFSARYRDLEAHLREARAIFPDTEVAQENQTYPVGANRSMDL